MIPDSLLLLAICIPVMLFERGPLRAAAATMFGSFVMVTGYEMLTGGYAVYGAYIVADMVCAAGLTLVLLHYDLSRPALMVALGFWLCCMVHGLKLMGVAPDVQLYWWVLRIINACQLLIIGGAGVWRGGKRIRRIGNFLPLGHGVGGPVAARIRNADR